MGYNEAITERMAILSVIDPQSVGTDGATGDVIDMDDHRRVVFILAIGAMQSTGTVDLAIKGDTASGGAYATTIPGKSITQLTEAGTDDNKQVMIEVTAEEVAAQSLRYLKPVVTVGVDASLMCLIALGDFARYSNATGYDLASVDEIVN